MRGPHYSDKVGDPEERDDDDQGLHGSQVDILCLVVVVVRSQLRDHNLGTRLGLQCQTPVW